MIGSEMYAPSRNMFADEGNARGSGGMDEKGGPAGFTPTLHLERWRRKSESLLLESSGSPSPGLSPSSFRPSYSLGGVVSNVRT